MRPNATIRILLSAAALFAGSALAAPPAAPSASAAAGDGLAPPVATAVDPASATLRHGRELSALFLGGDTAAVWTRFSPDMQAAMPAEALDAFRAQVQAQLGAEVSVVSEQTLQAQGAEVYVRTARWSGHDGDIVMQWAFDADGRVAGFVVRPAAGAPAA